MTIPHTNSRGHIITDNQIRLYVSYLLRNMRDTVRFFINKNEQSSKSHPLLTETIRAGGGPHVRREMTESAAQTSEAAQMEPTALTLEAVETEGKKMPESVQETLELFALKKVDD